MAKVTICGIPHTVVRCKDHFGDDLHFGQISYADATIRINEDLDEEIAKETLCHEILHGIFVHLGYEDLSQDERLVQGIAQAINQAFEVKSEGRDV